MVETRPKPVTMDSAVLVTVVCVSVAAQALAMSAAGPVMLGGVAARVAHCPQDTSRLGQWMRDLAEGATTSVGSQFRPSELCVGIDSILDRGVGRFAIVVDRDRDGMPCPACEPSRLPLPPPSANPIC